MKGTISFYNADEQRGSIKGDDGNIYDFYMKTERSTIG